MTPLFRKKYWILKYYSLKYVHYFRFSGDLLAQEKSLLDALTVASKQTNDYWVSHWEKIKAYDVVCYTNKLPGCLQYYLASPVSGFMVPIICDRSYSVSLKKPYVEVIFYWKNNKLAQKHPTSIGEVNIFNSIDSLDLFGKDEILSHLESLAKQDKFIVDSEKAKTTMEEALQKLTELRQQLLLR
jgi:hypothetical protein